MELSKPKLAKKDYINSVKCPLVSIITPTYNHEKFIGTCIESVLGQTYQNWEMIIIDDGSTDNTGNIISKYQDNRIKYIKQENIGIWRLKETYNKALNLSKGDLISILEGDDYWPSYKLEKQVKIFKEHDIILSWGRVNTVNDKNEIISFYIQSLKPFTNMTQKEIIKDLMIFNFIQPCTVLMNKNALLSIGGFLQPKNAPFVDYATFLELSLKGRFYPSDEILGYWRKHNAQTTLKQRTKMNEAFMYPLNFYEKLDPEIKNSIEFNINDKIKIYNKIVNAQITESARLNLVKCNWNEAFDQYKGLLVKGDFSIKVQSFIGIICALCRKNIEWLAILTCRAKLRNASGEWDTTLHDKNKNLSLLFKIQIFTLNIFQRLHSRPILIAKF
jgi:Glycosyltransferases involved in cell wall biogenesis